MELQDQFPLQSNAELSMLTTWKMSYRQVRAIKPEAADLLDLWAFFSPGDIWYELVASVFETGAAILSHQLTFSHILGILSNYSLATPDAQNQRFSIHPVVHAWCLHNLATVKDKQRLCSRAIHLVVNIVPPSNGADNPILARRLLPHTRMVAVQYLRMQEYKGLQHELHAIADFLKVWESSQAVELLYLRALEGYEETLGAKHTSILDITHNLGIFYSDQDKREQAEKMYLRALKGKIEVLGANHISTLDTVHNLGSLYADQGKLRKAEEMYLRALRGKEKAFGEKHPLTLDVVNNLGSLYSDQGKLKKAEEKYMRALIGYEETWGVKHTSTLDTVNNLGLLYADQDKPEEAEEMYDRALRGYEEALGANHTSTLNTVNNLGSLYAYQGKLRKAEEMYERALRGKEMAWGAKHTSTLDTVYNLGNFYRDQGQPVEAREMYERAAKGYKEVEGDHDAEIRYLQEQLSLLDTQTTVRELLGPPNVKQPT
jgi:tetratricopeptide (TPR) repeat protein